MKKLLSIIAIFIVYLLTDSSYGFEGYTGSLVINLDSNTKTLYINENLDINIMFISNLNEDINIGQYIIDGIKKNSIKSKHVNKDIQLVGDTYLKTISINYVLDLYGTGYIELGPVKVPYGTGFIESNIIGINIIGNQNIIKKTINENSKDIKNSYNYSLYLLPIVFILILVSLYRYIKIIIKREEKIIININKFQTIDDILNDIGKENIIKKIKNPIIKKKYDYLIYKINKLKYSGIIDNLNQKNIQKYLIELYNLLK